MSSKCDSCRLGLPLYAIDSIHIRFSGSPREERLIIALMLVYMLSGGDRCGVNVHCE